MRCINKTGHIIGNSGETIVEVMVAFTLLSIMMVIFSQGITWATKSEMNAVKNRTWADSALRDFQNKYSQKQLGPGFEAVIDVSDRISGRVRRKVGTSVIDGQAYTYVYYEAVV